jgi:hypothetical protein
MKTTCCVVTLCALAALTSGCDEETSGIVSSDTVPSVDLTNGIAVCADDGINSIAASEIDWWLHSSPDARLDQRITAALEVSIKPSASTFHSGTTTTCESHGVGVAFVRPDGSVNGPAQLSARFTVTASPDGSPHVSVDRATLLSAAQGLIKLQDAELSREKLGAAN